MKITALVTVLLCSIIAGAQEVEPAVTVGTSHTLQSTVLEEERTYYVWTPDDYDETGLRYPVVYLLDAEMSLRFAKMVATVQELASVDIPEMIVVGICNTDRGRDMFPEGEGRNGEAHNFLTFIEKELIPLVDANYRTAPFRILQGHSNSALFVMYALFSKPTLFKGYIATSPMIGWMPETMTALSVSAVKEKKFEGAVVSIEYGDADYARVTEHVPPMLQMFEENNPDGLTWFHRILEGEGHVPYSCYFNGLRDICKGFSLSDEDLHEGGLEVAFEHYRKQTERFGFTIKVPFSKLFDLGWVSLRNEKQEGAEEVFNKALEMYPHEEMGYFGLGELARIRGEVAKTKEFFQKVLEMNPDLAPAKRRLEILEESENQ